jgi:hypothetical protein
LRLDSTAICGNAARCEAAVLIFSRQALRLPFLFGLANAYSHATGNAVISVSSHVAESEPNRFGVINAVTRVAQKLGPCQGHPNFVGLAPQASLGLFAPL